MKKLLVLLTGLIPGFAFSQSFSITKVEQIADKVNIYYDVIDPENRGYTVSVFSSRDNFITPLEKVSGDVGLEVKSGGNKKVVWSAKEELGNDFNGKVSLEIRGRVYIPFVRLDNMYKNMKRGKPYEFTWTGGTQQNILNFDLYRGDTKITSFPNIANVGHTTLTLPSTTKASGGYKFKITDSKNKDQIVFSPQFVVNRKIPLLLKAVPVILLGGAIYGITKANKGPQNIPDPATPGF